MGSDKAAPPERPTPKPPIYSCEVIEAASRVLQVISEHTDETGPNEPGLRGQVNRIAACALRIMEDGLASHERAIKGEP